MNEPPAALVHHRTVFDRWPSILAALYMTLVGYGVLVGIPVISTAWVGLLGFSEEQVGRLASADLGGLAFGAILISIFIGRMNRRVLIAIAVTLALVGNGLCMIFTGFTEVLLLRMVSGLGSGMLTAVAVATLGATSRPAFAFNLMLFAFCFSQALEVYFLPRLSMNGIYLAFSVAFLIALALVCFIPPRGLEPALDVEVDVPETGGRHHVEHRHVPAFLPWLCLTAMTFTYIHVGAYWTYIELAALDAGVSGEWTGKMLLYASFFTFVGCLVATLISDRFGLARPLFVALLVLIGTAAGLTHEITVLRFTLSVWTFNLLWIFIDVYQMGTIANFDHSGRFSSLIPAAQGVGQIIGPNAAASILGYQLGYGSVFAMCATAAGTALLVYFSVYVWLRRRLPALADAS